MPGEPSRLGARGLACPRPRAMRRQGPCGAWADRVLALLRFSRRTQAPHCRPRMCRRESRHSSVPLTHHLTSSSFLFFLALTCVCTQTSPDRLSGMQFGMLGNSGERDMR